MLTSRKPKSGIKAQPGRPAIEKIMAVTAKDESTGCWNYNGHVNAAGYGMYSLRQGSIKRQVQVHRMVWEHFNGPIPDGMCMLHECDNRRCCNPDHLRPGTHAENMTDAKNRNRMKKGTDSNLAVFNEDEVMSIRRMYDDGVSVRSIAHKFLDSRWAIYQIGRRNTWKHLPESGERPSNDFRQVLLVSEIVNVGNGVAGVTDLQPQQMIIPGTPVIAPKVRHERPSEVVTALYRFA